MKDKIGEAREILDTIGQENEHEGIRWTKKFMDAFAKKEWEKNQIKQDKLGKVRFSRKRYYEMLSGILNELSLEMDKSSAGWRIISYYTEKGIVMQIKNIMGRLFCRAFKPCGIPKIDLNAVFTLLGSAEDTMWKVDKDGDLDLKTKNGVYLK